ncbi:MAG: YciI family protein [Caulobacteraceae bacterium]|jgi:hypothetical protein|nr:YciI family protein [Caulobacteraceae bacterium]
MLYAILCYHDEQFVWSWTKEQEAAVIGGLKGVHETLTREGKLGPSLRLMPTTAATTLSKSKDLVLDGPFAETKEQLLGLYVIDVDGLEAALEVARQLARANPGGSYELRPIAAYNPDPREAPVAG